MINSQQKKSTFQYSFNCHIIQINSKLCGYYIFLVDFAFDLALEQTDERVKQGLMRVYEKILSDYEQGLETKDF